MNKVATESYTEELIKLHRDNEKFGQGTVTKRHYPFIESLIKQNSIKSVLDYGCGKGHLISHLSKNYPSIQTAGYDVANEVYKVLPAGIYDLTVCMDVLEHVEFGLLRNVLQTIQAHTGRFFVASIANYPAGKKLSDGRNAHVTQLPFAQWHSYLSLYFKIALFRRTRAGEAIFLGVPLRDDSDWR